MRLPPQLRIALGPSRIGRAFVAVLSVATAFVVCALPVSWWLRLGGCVALAAFWIARHRAFGPRPGPGHVLELALTANRLIVVRCVDGTLRAGFVRDVTCVSASLTAIVWKPDGARRSRSILILPDMLPADDYRRLRVLLRYGRSEEEAAAPASQA